MTGTPRRLFFLAAIAAFSIALLVAPGRAVEIRPGQIYEGGTSLTASDVGVTFTIPSGWRAGLPAGAEALVMERLAGGAMILVMAQEVSEAEVMREMSQNVDLGGGAFLQPLAYPTTRPDGVLTADYQLVGGQVPGQGAAFTRLGKTGVGVVFFAVDTSADQAGRTAASQLVDGVRFSKPVAPTPAGAEGSAPWGDYMRGRYIARYYSGSGYHEKTELWLCSDGTFHRSGDSGGFGGGASGAFAHSSAGRWSAGGTQPAQGQLRLETSEGVATYALSLADGKLYLDGTQWLRGDNEVCP